MTEFESAPPQSFPAVWRPPVARHWVSLAAGTSGLALGGTAVYLATQSWRLVAVLSVLVAFLAPIAVAVRKAPADEDDWWSPIWSAPPLVGLYGLTCLVLAGGYLRRGNIADLSILLAGAAAATLCGAFLGFIFAIPRSLQQQPEQATDSADYPYYAPNTNLEQISDWLTKIIVGISLVEFRAVGVEFEVASGTMAAALGMSGNDFLAAAILLTYVVAGFFCSYIWTRLKFASDLTSLERTARDSGEYLEGLANAYLYQQAPKGYTKSLKLSDRYLVRFGRDNDRVWLYIACACGQMHRDLRLQYGVSPTDEQRSQLKQTEKKAFDALVMVRDLAPRQYDIAHALWDPRESSEDGDDLHSFYGLESFGRFFHSWALQLADRAEETAMDTITLQQVPHFTSPTDALARLRQYKQTGLLVSGPDGFRLAWVSDLNDADRYKATNIGILPDAEPVYVITSSDEAAFNIDIANPHNTSREYERLLIARRHNYALFTTGRSAGLLVTRHESLKSALNGHTLECEARPMDHRFPQPQANVGDDCQRCPDNADGTHPKLRLAPP